MSCQKRRPIDECRRSLLARPLRIAVQKSAGYSFGIAIRLFVASIAQIVGAPKFNKPNVKSQWYSSMYIFY